MKIAPLHVLPTAVLLAIFLLYIITKDSPHPIVQLANSTLASTGISLIIGTTVFVMRTILSREDHEKVMKKVCVVDDKMVRLDRKMKLMCNDIDEIKKILDKRLP